MVAEEKQAADETLQPKIEQRAYAIWQSEGSPHGCDVDHWLRAEAEILSSPPSATPSPDTESQSASAKGKGKR